MIRVKTRAHNKSEIPDSVTKHKYSSERREPHD